MNSRFSSLLHSLQAKPFSLNEYTEYLHFELHSPFKKLSQSLTQRNISLSEYLQYFEARVRFQKTENFLDPEEKNRFEKIGQVLLMEKRITLTEINQILQHLIPLECRNFLQQLLRLRKISLEEFIPFLQENRSPLPHSIYRLRAGSNIEFYVETEENIKKYGPYLVLEELGRGGMGIVYKAYHEKLNRIIALKTLLASKGSAEKMRKRFLQEIEVMAQLQHEGIVQIYDSGIEKEELYLVMEYVEGKSLNKISAQMSLNEKVSLVQQVLEALDYAHQQGIIHRDLKLENILVSTGGVPKIADFGLAKKVADPAENAEKLTKTGAIIGTIHYLAPEQARGEAGALDARTDVYAIGICLYYLLTSRFPYRGENTQHLLRHIIYEEPIPPSKFVPHLRRDLETIILKSLEKEKSARYSSAKQFAEDLERFLSGVPVEAIQTSPKIKIQKWVRRYKKLLFLSILLFGSSLLGIQTQIWFASQERTQIFEQKYQLALEKIQNLTSLPQENTLIYLSVWTTLNEALQIFPNEAKTEQQKWEIGEKLLQASLNKETHYLGDYVLQEMQQMKNISFQIKNERKQRWIFQKKQKQQTEEQRFDYWISRLQTGTFEKKEGEEALYQIIKMSAPAITLKLLETLQEGNLFFNTLEKYTQQARTKTHYYIWIVRLIGKRKIKEALPQICEGLSTLIVKVPFESDPQLILQRTHYLVELSKYFFAINAYAYADFLDELRHISGQGSLFWKSTEFLIQKLYQKKLSVEAIYNFSNPLENYLAQGNQHYYSGNFKAAIENFTQALQLKPDEAEIYNKRALAKRADNDIEGAIEDYNTVLRLHPELSKIYNNRGNSKRAKLDYKGAILDFTESIRLDHNSAEAYNNRGNVWMDLENYEQALFDFSQAVCINPQLVDGYNNRGNAKKAKRDYQGAIADYDKAIELYPQSTDAYNGRGSVKKDIADFEGAIADFTQVICINPKYQEAYSNRGNTKLLKQDYHGAITDYTEAIRLDPRYKDAYYNRGNVKQSLQDYDGAIADYNEAIRLDPNDAEFYYNRGIAKFYKRAFEEASVDFTAAIRLRPTDMEFYFFRGESKREKKDFEGAIADYSETLRLDPQYFSAYLNRGSLYLHVKKNSINAKKDFQKFIQLTRTQSDVPEIAKAILFIYRQFPELKEQ